MKKILGLILSFLICVVILVGISYLYFKTDITHNSENAQAKKEDVPYFDNTPENTGVLIRLPDNSGLLFYLNFKEEKISAVNISQCAKENAWYNGYYSDKNIYADYDFISELVDRIGGINTVIDGQNIRLTGVDVVSMMKSNKFSIDTAMISALMENIVQNGFSKDDLSFLLSSGDKTDLTLSDCIVWLEYLPEMFKNITIVPLDT